MIPLLDYGTDLWSCQSNVLKKEWSDDEICCEATPNRVLGNAMEIPELHGVVRMPEFEN
ncbi:hypothetical protein AVEN_183295-1, partial [Araneus ventricosus]